MTVGSQQALPGTVTLLLSLVKSQQDLHSKDESTYFDLFLSHLKTMYPKVCSKLTFNSFAL